MVGIGIAVDKLVLLRRMEAGTKPDDAAIPPVDCDSAIADLESLLSQPAMRMLLMAALLTIDAATHDDHMAMVGARLVGGVPAGRSRVRSSWRAWWRRCGVRWRQLSGGGG